MHLRIFFVVLPIRARELSGTRPRGFDKWQVELSVGEIFSIVPAETRALSKTLTRQFVLGYFHSPLERNNDEPIGCSGSNSGPLPNYFAGRHFNGGCFDRPGRQRQTHAADLPLSAELST
jgi:hypothetical protein